MPITITRLFGFEGPNIISPQPGLLLEARATVDISAPLRNAIKDIGQQIGMVVSALNIGVHKTGQSFELTADFATPTPAVAKAAVQYIIDGLNAHESGDDTWDADQGLEILHERRLAEALPFAALQIIAEANRRSIPSFRRADGALQIGYGRRGLRLDLGVIRFDQRRDASELIQSLPWHSLGTIPLLAISGIDIYVTSDERRTANDERMSNLLIQGGAQAAWLADLENEVAHSFPKSRVGTLAAARFAEVRDLLCLPDLDIAILDLAPTDLLQTGLPFEQCLVSAIGGVAQPAVAYNTEEAARTIALPLLVTSGHGLLVAPTPAISDLAAYAACPVTTVSLAHFLPAFSAHAKYLVARVD